MKKMIRCSVFIVHYFVAMCNKNRTSNSNFFTSRNNFPIYLGQALDLLVMVSCTPHGASTSILSTLYSPGGLADLMDPWISHLEVGFTLRCLQRLSDPDLATLLWNWFPAGAPVIRPSRSSRTKDSSSQISYAYAG